MSDNYSISSPPRIGITHGDINGISYELILKAFSDSRILGMTTPILYGQSKALSYYKKNFGMDDFTYSLTRDARQAWKQKFNIINIVEQELKIEPGAVTAVSADMSALSMKKGTDDLKDGYIDALLLAPSCHEVDKTQQALFQALFGATDVLRLLVSDRLRVALATDMMSPKEALASIDAALVGKKLATLSAALKTDFGVTAPKIAVLALDPSALADDVTAVAVAEARKKNLFAFGPFRADALFASGDWTKYDAVLALYFDQGTLPFRLLSTNGVAFYWAGLPAICAGPLQGPEFAQANANQAAPDSLRQALYLALDIIGQRSQQ